MNSKVSTLLKDYFSKDLKTTTFGFVALLITFSKYIGVSIPQDVVEAIVVLCVFLISFFTKDKNVDLR